MRKLQNIEQALLKLSASETKRLLAWIDHHLEEETEVKDALSAAMIQQGKRQISERSPRLRQP